MAPFKCGEHLCSRFAATVVVPLSGIVTSPNAIEALSVPEVIKGEK
jgi:hypothetical protein